MKYCMSYMNTSKYMDEVDEIIVLFDRKRIERLFSSFIPEHQERGQRIIVELRSNSYQENLEDLKTIIKVHEEKPELAFDLMIYNREKEFMELLQASGIKYFFCDRVRDWDTFLGILKYKPSDIYIVEQLGFELDKIAQVAHEKGVKIRVYPNVAQSSWSNIPDIYKFFIRPEDVDTYSEYVDVCEIFGDSHKCDVYYKVYAKDRKWFGDLSEIIIDLHENFDSRFIIPRFAERRIKCGKKCLKGGYCHMCDRVIELSKSLKDAKLLIKMDKKKESEETDGKRAVKQEDNN